MLLVLIFYFPSLVFAHIGYSTQSYCLEQIESGILSLGCPTNQLIKLGRIIYGYSWSDDCSYIDKDCTMDVPREDIMCLSTTNCTVRVVEHPLILQDCWNLAATYVQAEYECITDYSIQNICQPQDIILSHGFLSTPNYPNGFLSNLNCQCGLFPPPGHSIILEIIYFHLPICAEAGFILWLGQNFQTKCLTQDPVTLISNIQQNITLRFYSLKNNKQGGFLMKYSVTPESENATIRLQCYTAPAINRSTISNSLLNSKSPLQVQNIFEQKDAMELSVTNPNDLSRHLQSGASIIEIHKNVSSMHKQQQQLQSLNQSIYKKNFLPNSSQPPRTNMTLVIIFIITIVVFLMIINILIWFMCSLRPKRSRSTSSIQNLYSHQIPLNNEPKTSNRLKTLHSLLYANHKSNDTDPITTNPIRHFDSILSECRIPSNCSSTNLNHGFIIKSKSNQKLHEPRQINSWDDI